MDIVEFLRARLDEDEAAAGNARPHEHLNTRDASQARVDDLGNGYLSVGITSGRMLREVEAKRWIVDEQAWSADTDCASDPFRCSDCLGDGERHNAARDGFLLLAALASVYADHPDYDPEWR